MKMNKFTAILSICAVLSCKKDEVVTPSEINGIQTKISKGTSDSFIGIGWDTIKGEKQYSIWRKENTSAEYLKIAQVYGDTFQDNSVKSINWYQYKVIPVGNSNQKRISIPDSGYKLLAYEKIDKFSDILSDPFGITIKKNKYLYIADKGNGKIVVYDFTGNKLKEFGKGTLTFPRGLDFDKNGFLYVADSNNKIYKFDSLDNLVTSWGNLNNGQGDGEFNGAMRDIAIDQNNNNLIIVDHNNDRIQVFDFTGNFIRKWGSKGEGDDQFNYPWGSEVMANGDIIVSQLYKTIFFSNTGIYKSNIKEGANFIYQNMETGNFYTTNIGVIRVYDKTYRKIAQFSFSGWDYLMGIAADNEGNIYVNDYSNDLYKFSIKQN